MESGKLAARFSEPVIKLLQDAGWYEGRNVLRELSLPPSFTLFPAAEQVLAEFGGLTIGICGPGIELATNDIQIQPGLAVGLEEELIGLEGTLKSKLYPLGDVCHHHATLLIDQVGRIYHLFDDLEFLATSFDSGLEILLLGLRVRPENS